MRNPDLKVAGDKLNALLKTNPTESKWPKATFWLITVQQIFSTGSLLPISKPPARYRKYVLIFEALQEYQALLQQDYKASRW